MVKRRRTKRKKSRMKNNRNMIRGKSMKRKSMKRKSMKRKSMKRKSMKRKSMKRKSMKRKSMKRKILYGGMDAAAAGGAAAGMDAAAAGGVGSAGWWSGLAAAEGLERAHWGAGQEGIPPDITHTVPINITVEDDGTVIDPYLYFRTAAGGEGVARDINRYFTLVEGGVPISLKPYHHTSPFLPFEGAAAPPAGGAAAAAPPEAVPPSIDKQHDFLDLASTYNQWKEMLAMARSDPGLVNVTPLGRWSALHQAAAATSALAAERAAEKGLDPKEFSSAAIDAVHDLLDIGADPGAKNRDGNKPIELTDNAHVKGRLKIEEPLFSRKQERQHFQKGREAETRAAYYLPFAFDRVLNHVVDTGNIGEATRGQVNESKQPAIFDISFKNSQSVEFSTQIIYTGSAPPDGRRGYAGTYYRVLDDGRRAHLFMGQVEPKCVCDGMKKDVTYTLDAATLEPRTTV